MFSLVFGIVTPAFCFSFDPGVFRAGDFGPILGAWVLPGIVAVSFAGLQAATLVGLFICEQQGRVVRAFVSGWLFAGGLLSLTLGLLVLFFALVAALCLQPIGWLGLTPMLTAYVFFAWSSCLRRRGSEVRRASRVGWVAGVILAVAVLLGGRSLVHSVSVDVIQAAVSGSDEDFARAHEKLRRWQAVIPSARLARALRAECASISRPPHEATIEDLPDRIRRLALALSTVTGRPPLVLIHQAVLWYSD